MTINVFVLGRPGTGKSTAARRIREFAESQGLHTTHTGDYDILQRMSKNDVECKRFRPIAYDGFDVRDPAVFGEALLMLESRIRKLTRPLEREGLITIEFARDNYLAALKTFNHDFLYHAYFLFLHADVETCVQRVRERMMHPTKQSDHYISEEAIKTYYLHDDVLSITENLKVHYGIHEQQVKIIHNIFSPSRFHCEIDTFVQAIFKQETDPQTEQVPIVSPSNPVTEPMRALPLMVPVDRPTTS